MPSVQGLVAFDAATGQPTPFDPDARGPVLALAVSDGVVYAGGNFTQAGGQPRQDLAALDAATGQTTAFDRGPRDPRTGGSVFTLTSTGGALYAGGSFNQIGGRPRRGLAAFRTSDTQVAAERDLPSGVSLGPPSPNPARSRATLTVEVDRPQRVRADVVNVLGQRVATAFDGPVAPGAAVPLTVDVSGLAAGVYVVRVAGETFAASRRITVVR